MICDICPRNCRDQRDEKTGSGICKMPESAKLARAALHFWEEPPISGKNGSGTIFFSGCSLKCVFCQNQKISREDYGKIVSMKRLREICGELIAQGAHNINFVNPTHYAHIVEQVLNDPLPVPAVWNTGGYEKVDTLKRLEGKIQIYLPDLKYVSEQLGVRYSCAADYPETAKKAILEMVRQTGPVQIGEDGIMQRGVIIRHLVLPGQTAEAKKVMDWVAETFAPGEVLFSLMSQYTPCGDLSRVPEINRKLRKGEIRVTRDYMDNLNLDGFYQERTSAKEEYIPPFDLSGL